MAKTVKRVTVRLDEEQNAFLTLLARRLGTPEAEILRLGLSSLYKKLPPGWQSPLHNLPPETLQALNTLSYEINRIGMNLNQVLHAGHIRGWDQGSIVVLQREIYELKQLTPWIAQEVSNICRLQR